MSYDRDRENEPQPDPRDLVAANIEAWANTGRIGEIIADVWEDDEQRLVVVFDTDCR